MTKQSKGPRGGKTTIAPSGWQKTTIYLRPEQNRMLKQTALDSDQTMSEVLRQAVDCYLGLEESELSLSEAQRAVVKDILREGFSMHPEHIAKVLDALEAGSDTDSDK